MLVFRDQFTRKNRKFRVHRRPFDDVQSLLADALAEYADFTQDESRSFSQVLLGATALVRALDRLTQDARYYLFRKPTLIELYRAGRAAYVNVDEIPHHYHFYEVFGYRFIVLLNLEGGDGFIGGAARVNRSLAPSAAEQLRTLQLQ